jgi:hypothetical protein
MHRSLLKDTTPKLHQRRESIYLRLQLQGLTSKRLSTRIQNLNCWQTVPARATGG